MPSLQQLLNELHRHIGVKQLSAEHRAIIDAYNHLKPLPVGYKMNYHDDWCDAFVTFIADRVGLSKQIGRECGVERHLQLMAKQGVWLGKIQPKVGDIVIFDWDNGGFADHIGFVEEVQAHQIKTIEGNVNRQVQRCIHQLNAPYIRGYARPAYEKIPVVTKIKSLDQIVKEVIRGIWGNGSERVRRLTEAGYSANVVQKLVNQQLQY